MGSPNMETRLSRAARVVMVLLERTDQGLELLLRLEHEPDHSVTEWRFRGVCQLRFRGESTGLMDLVRLQSEDTRTWQWDGVRFRVFDYEEEFISFFCEGIEEIEKDGAT